MFGVDVLVGFLLMDRLARLFHGGKVNENGGVSKHERTSSVLW